MTTPESPPIHPTQPPVRAPLAVLPPPLRGVTAFVLLLVNTLWWCSLLFVLALLRLLLPLPAVQGGGVTAWRGGRMFYDANNSHSI